MKFPSFFLSGGIMFVASAWIPEGASFRSVSVSSRCKGESRSANTIIGIQVRRSNNHLGTIGNSDQVATQATSASLPRRTSTWPLRQQWDDSGALSASSIARRAFSKRLLDTPRDTGFKTSTRLAPSQYGWPFTKKNGPTRNSWICIFKSIHPRKSPSQSIDRLFLFIRRNRDSWPLKPARSGEQLACRLNPPEIFFAPKNTTKSILKSSSPQNAHNTRRKQLQTETPKQRKPKRKTDSGMTIALQRVSDLR